MFPTTQHWRIFLATLLAIAAASGGASAEPMPLAVAGARSEYVVVTPQPSSQFLLLVGSLAPPGRSVRITVRTEACAGPEALPRAAADQDAAWPARLGDLKAETEQFRRERRPKAPAMPLAQPPRSKTFHIFLGTHDLENRQRYQAVPADLHPLLGQHCQVYVDRDDATLPHLDAAVRDITRAFDAEIQPWAAAKLGQVDDVDGDGRFTIFLTRWLDKLQHGQTRLDGFVRGSDFLPDHRAPFGNSCDMLYLNANLAAGPHLRTILAHEYTHAVLFCERQRAAGRDEESWLHEGLAHLVEARLGYDVRNVDHRVGGYLSAPERYPLLLPDYYGEGVWRTPGVRGAAFLFLQHCWRQGEDDDLPRRLIQSPFHGLDNVEAVAQQPFARLFREFSLSLLGREHFGRFQFGRSERGTGATSPGVMLCGPNMLDVQLDHGANEASLAGSAVAIFRLHSPAGKHARVVLQAESAAPLQATLVPLPDSAPRLELRERVEDGGWRLTLLAHHSAVTLRGLAWQCQGLVKSPEGSVAPATWFPTAQLAAGKAYHSPFLNGESFAGRGPVLFRVWGEDERGAPTASWLLTNGQRSRSVLKD